MMMSMPRRKALLFLLVVSVLGATACGLRTRGAKLQSAVTAYNENMRWLRIPQAAQALAPDRRMAWIARLKAVASDLNILEYEVRPIRISDNEAVFEVDLSYYVQPEVHVRRLKRHQRWIYEHERWVLDSEREAVQDKPSRPVEGCPELSSP